MHVLGPIPDSEAEPAVHTIDVWFDPARRAWVLERLDAAGDPVGIIHLARTRRDAMACIAHWRRQHRDLHLVAALERPARSSR